MNLLRRMNSSSSSNTRKPTGVSASFIVAVGALIALLVSGCATTPSLRPIATRPFNFQTDTFAYSNQLAWEYSFNTNGDWSAHKRVPKADYALHCFPMTRAAERFFFNARFDATQPTVAPAIYRHRIHAALSGQPGQVIPGYANLRDFSLTNETLLKEECGSAWRSYLQRGNWRMVFPLTRAHQAKTADQLAAALKNHRLPIIHLARFPQQTINHAVLLFNVEESPSEIRFTAYDPNITDHPMVLTYDRKSRTFLWPRSHYFGGGRVDVYQIYHKWDY
jgi:hypothetical protein